MLKDHLTVSKIKRRDFAKLIDVTPSYLSQLESGSRRPSLELAFRIEEATNGAVPAACWIAENPAPTEAASE